MGLSLNIVISVEGKFKYNFNCTGQNNTVWKMTY